MPIPHHRIGQTTIARVKGSDDLKRIMNDPLLESETVIIKPNWVTSERAAYTEADSFRTILETLDSRIVVTESHMIARAPSFFRDGGPSFLVGEKEVNWKWLLKGEGWNWLAENRDWDWFKKNGHWDQLKKEDQAFLDKYGFTDIFNEFDAIYINVTEEVWKDRTADPDEIKKIVESQFSPVHTEEIYNTAKPFVGASPNLTGNLKDQIPPEKMKSLVPGKSYNFGSLKVDVISANF